MNTHLYFKVLTLLFFCLLPTEIIYADSTSTPDQFLQEVISHITATSSGVVKKVTRKDLQLHVISTVSSRAFDIHADTSSNTYNYDISLSNITQYVSTSTKDYNYEKKFSFKITKNGDKKVNTFTEQTKVRNNKILADYIRGGEHALEVSVPDSKLKLLSSFDMDTLSRFILNRPIKVSNVLDDQTLTTKLTNPIRSALFVKTLLTTVYVKNDLGEEQYVYADAISSKTGSPKAEYVLSRHIQVGISVLKLKEAFLTLYRSDIQPKGMTYLDYVRLINFFDSASFTNTTQNTSIDVWVNPKNFEVLRVDLPTTTISYQDDLDSIATTIDFDMSDKKILQGTVITFPDNPLAYSLLKKKMDSIIKNNTIKKTSSGTVK